MKASLTRSTLALALLAALPLACSHEDSTPGTTTTTSVLSPPWLEPSSPGKPNSSVYLSDRLRSACAITTIESIKQSPEFEFDQSAILPEDQDVLAAVARCVTTGPLAGRSLKFVGRADPRGTEEYNMALGERRSDAVMKYLSGLGVNGARMTETSRGALDAKGYDEATWRQDRRVDIDVVGGP